MSSNSNGLSVDGDGDEENEDPVMEITSTARKPHTRVYESAFHYKFLIAKAGSLHNCQIYAIRHPKTGSRALFEISTDSINEVLRMDDPCRSFFYGDTVIADGSMMMLSPLHPLFLAIPYLMKNAENRYIPLDDCLVDEEYVAIGKLQENSQLIGTIDRISDCKEACEITVYRYNAEKCLEWLRERFARLKSALLENGTLHHSITHDDSVLQRYTFGILCDYLQPILAKDLKKHLQIPDIAITTKPTENDMGMTKKRKADDDEDAIKSQPVKKTPELNAVQKRLQQASKGTKSIMGFFTKKS